jgi:nicotinamide-nucleotide amidase
MAEQDLIEPARALLDLCRAKKLVIAAAESCTGGLLAATLTEIPGSSQVFDRGFVTYSNDAKIAMLGVPVDLLETFGAVSREAAQAMASGALAQAGVDLAVAITGIAGPGGATATKPVGLVYFGIARRHGACRTERHVYAGDRAAIRRDAALHAFELLLAAATGQTV